jgi:hypothetical protein
MMASKIYVWYISREGLDVVIRTYPVPGCRVVRTILTMDDFDNPKVFKTDKAIWAFAMNVGERWVESSSISPPTKRQWLGPENQLL